MKRVLFIGACDKRDLLLYCSKILSRANEKVLLVDATQEIHYRYCIPMTKSDAQLIEFDQFDVALGFRSFGDLQSYFGDKGENLEAYTTLIIDTDRLDSVGTWANLDQRVLVTSFDRSCMERNGELLERFCQIHTDRPHFQLVFYPLSEGKINEEYVTSMLESHPVMWGEETYGFHHLEGDYEAKIDNQYESRLRMRKLSKYYRQSLFNVMSASFGLELRDIKTAFRKAERS